MTQHRNYRYYDFVMAAFVTVLVCSNLIGPAKISQIDAPLVGTLTFGAGVRTTPCSVWSPPLLQPETASAVIAREATTALHRTGRLRIDTTVRVRFRACLRAAR